VSVIPKSTREGKRAINYRVSSTLTCYAVILPTLILLLTFIYLPVFWAFSKSVFDFEIGGDSRFVGAANYVQFFRNDPITYSSMLHMLFFTVFAVCIRLSIPLVVAKLILCLPSEKWKHIYRTAFMIPIIVPPVAVQLIWAGMIYSNSGVLNTLLTTIGLESWTSGWLSDPGLALFSCAMIGFPFVGGFDVLVYYAGLSAIPDSVNEAATLEGCVGVKKFFLIDIPMTMSQLKLILILAVMGGIQGFEGLLLVTRGGPGFQTMVPGLWMYFEAFSFQRFGYACAIGVVLFLMILVVTLLNIKYFRSAEDIKETA
jgi:raffinose/stachyose/melibiose transport system permease protein